LHHLGPLAHALGAAHPDRGRGHAVGADRPPAGGAGDTGLAVRVSVTGLGHRDGEPTIAPMPPPSPARLYATLVGAVLVVLGLLGFFSDLSWLNFLYVGGGALGLVLAAC